MKIHTKIGAEEEIHQLRVTVKRLRALVRLLKAKDPKGFFSLNRKLRALGRSLSKYRDDAVRAKWLRKHGLASPIPRTLDSGTRRRLKKGVSRTAKEAWEKTRTHLRDSSAIGRAIEISISRMLKAKKKALKRRRDEDFHAWRKRTKDLLFQLEFLGIRKERSHLKQLGHQLGLAQDCVLMEQYLRSHPITEKDRARSQATREKVRSQRRALQIAKSLPSHWEIDPVKAQSRAVRNRGKTNQLALSAQLPSTNA